MLRKKTTFFKKKVIAISSWLTQLLRFEAPFTRAKLSLSTRRRKPVILKKVKFLLALPLLKE